MAKITLAGVAVVVVSAAVFLFLVYPSLHGPGSGRDVELMFAGDESSDAIAARLTAAGLIESPRLFAFYARTTSLHAARGAHLLTDDLSPREIARRLVRSPLASHQKVTIPEGWTRFDIAKRLQSLHVASARAFFDASTDRALLDSQRIKGESFEGYLFPATYDFASDSDPADVIRRMKSEFDKRYAALAERHDSGLLDLSQSLSWGMSEIVTLASIVEKEAAVAEERPIIASVFLNRLRDPSFKNKMLQSDPTSGYGCLVMRDAIPSCASFNGKITHDINADPANPYTTYVLRDKPLPPGPICNPGARSIEAVMNPATTKYLYFMAKGDGHSTFSETYDAHKAAVRDATHK